MVESPREKIRKRMEHVRNPPKSLVNYDDIWRIGVSSDVCQELLSCLDSSDPLDVADGLFFLIGLLRHHSWNSFDADFQSRFITILPSLLMHPRGSVRSLAIPLFVHFKDNFCDYRQQMMRLLADSDLTNRSLALKHYGTFSIASEITPLLRFKGDDYVGELSMNGQFVYELRDIALEQIESKTGMRFRINIRSEDFDGTKVYWYDWVDFLRWFADRRGA